MKSARVFAVLFFCVLLVNGCRQEQLPVQTLVLSTSEEEVQQWEQELRPSFEIWQEWNNLKKELSPEAIAAKERKDKLQNEQDEIYSIVEKLKSSPIEDEEWMEVVYSKFRMCTKLQIHEYYAHPADKQDGKHIICIKPFGGTAANYEFNVDLFLTASSTVQWEQICRAVYGDKLESTREIEMKEIQKRKEAEANERKRKEKEEADKREQEAAAERKRIEQEKAESDKKAAELAARQKAEQEKKEKEAAEEEQARRATRAIEKYMDQMRTLNKQKFVRVSESSSTQALRWAYEVRKIDDKDCPIDFRNAKSRYVNEVEKAGRGVNNEWTESWNELKATAAKYGVFVSDFMVGY